MQQLISAGILEQVSNWHEDNEAADGSGIPVASKVEVLVRIFGKLSWRCLQTLLGRRWGFCLGKDP